MTAYMDLLRGIVSDWLLILAIKALPHGGERTRLFKVVNYYFEIIGVTIPTDRQPQPDQESV